MAVTLLDGAGVVGLAVWADYAVGPTFGFEEVNRGLFIGEFFEEFKGAEIAFVVAVDGGFVVGHAVSICLKLLW